MYRLCKQHRWQYVQLMTNDGMVYEGMIENVDRDHVYLLVPMDEMRSEDDMSDDYDQSSDTRQFFPGFGFGGFGRRRRFRRILIPLIFLAALSPWF